ncbi:MAG: N-6 DNA methylase, partial [Lutibacter sp.]|nr:N-6 DNA methylase [Lutibacter sp.]
MALFQSSIITKHLQNQNKENIAIKWEAFINHFHNPRVQEEIKSLKEEQYQGEFLEDFFVKILGYTKPASSSETKFNLTTEYKNIKDSKKADGAIIVNDAVKAVIELKGTNTTDLGKIEVQAFGYKNNQPECTYVITSNFEKLRFYIDNAIEHIEFNLFTLTEKDFSLLYLCLAYENIEKDIPKKIKDQSISQEDAITKKLYNDYSLFKRELHQSLVILNPQFDALTLFQKSQKLLDRFLFLFFAEDRQLLPPNSVRMILEQWKKLQELDEPIPLYNRFKKYFGYLNTGFKGKQYDVYAYNGGLFLPDEVLDNITIDDDLLYLHTLKLSEYDFISEVDVNILGHIFENSLNELDEIKAQLAGETVDKSKTKRKKDGVFYTPKYITKYIVENTVGKLCEEKKTELEIIEEEFVSTRGLTRGLIPLPKKKKQQLLEKLSNYRNWLLQLSICDPACGSGAFLNQALDFLINEHKYIDELQAKLFGDAIVLSDVEKSILENNLFGVDLNEESVEIAKLSLWLRTAQPNRKLNDLNNNIKCGNSLIDDPEIAGEKAFNWQQEFPQIFKEKNKKAFHITTAVHDSRTSQRMIDFKVREKRDLGTNPYPNISYFTEDDEFIITQTIANIVKEDSLNVLAYNICA